MTFTAEEKKKQEIFLRKKNLKRGANFSGQVLHSADIRKKANKSVKYKNSKIPRTVARASFYNHSLHCCGWDYEAYADWFVEYYRKGFAVFSPSGSYNPKDCFMAPKSLVKLASMINKRQAYKKLWSDGYRFTAQFMYKKKEHYLNNFKNELDAILYQKEGTLAFCRKEIKKHDIPLHFEDAFLEWLRTIEQQPNEREMELVANLALGSYV